MLRFFNLKDNVNEITAGVEHALSVESQEY
jgi:hypothetical protein